MDEEELPAHPLEDTGIRDADVAAAREGAVAELAAIAARIRARARSERRERNDAGTSPVLDMWMIRTNVSFYTLCSALGLQFAAIG